MEQGKKTGETYFKFDKKELANAQEIIDCHDVEIEEYDLSHSYDENLNETPEDLEDMSLYADVLIAVARIEYEKPEKDRDWQQIAKNLGMAGVLRKMTKHFADAEKLLKASLELIQGKKLSQNLYVQQSVRLHDTQRRMKAYEESLQGLTKIVDLCSKNEAVAQYLDFAIQHLGKTQFTMGKIDEAMKSFQRALELRMKKQDRDLIESSQTAIKACQKKMRAH